MGRGRGQYRRVIQKVLVVFLFRRFFCRWFLSRVIETQGCGSLVLLVGSFVVDVFGSAFAVATDACSNPVVLVGWVCSGVNFEQVVNCCGRCFVAPMAWPLPFFKKGCAVLSVRDVVEVFSSGHGCPLLARPPRGTCSLSLCSVRWFARPPHFE